MDRLDNFLAICQKSLVLLYSEPLISPTIMPETKKNPSAADTHIYPLPVKYCQAEG